MKNKMKLMYYHKLFQKLLLVDLLLLIPKKWSVSESCLTLYYEGQLLINSFLIKKLCGGDGN